MAKLDIHAIREEDFASWFGSQCSPYSYMCEYFYTDVEEPDERRRRELLLEWLKAAHHEGFKCGRLYPDHSELRKAVYDKLWETCSGKVGVGIDCDVLTDAVLDVVYDQGYLK